MRTLGGGKSGWWDKRCRGAEGAALEAACRPREIRAETVVCTGPGPIALITRQVVHGFEWVGLGAVVQRRGTEEQGGVRLPLLPLTRRVSQPSSPFSSLGLSFVEAKHR